VGAVSGPIGGAIQSFLGGVIYEIIQFGLVSNTWRGAIADIRSNVRGIVGSLSPFQSCAKACDPCKGQWNP
jgi:hypothetical protein